MNHGPEQNRQPDSRGPLHPPVRSAAIWGPIVGVAVVALIVVIGVWRHVQQRREQERFAQQTTQLAVNVVSAQRDRKPKDLILPGTFNAFQETTIFPRSNGYVKSWKVDIGIDEGRVSCWRVENAGGRSLACASESELRYRKVTMVAGGIWLRSAAQENDEKQEAAKAAKANLEQLEKTQGFKQIVAPFGGKISARFVDVGALVTAGSGSAGTPLFGIVQSDPLRVYVYLPQANAPSIHEGLSAKILLQEFPGKEFDGTVTRTAGALDPQSRTMQVEVQVPNHEGKLYAGMYGQVKFSLVNEDAPIVLPANTFLFRTAGPQVATINKENRIHWQGIQIGRDFGTEIEVTDGLAENTKVVMNPTDDLRENVQVQVKPSQKPEGQTGSPSSGSNR